MALLDGRVIVVTGAGRGIGAAIARAAAAEGAAVVVNDVDRDAAETVADEIAGTGGRAVAHVCDISGWEAAAGLMETAVATFGWIDGLVNNAGVFGLGRLEEMTETSLRALIETNLIGAAQCATHAVRRMTPGRPGAIVNMVSGAQAGIPAMGVYGATKGGLASFTYAWAAELADRGIRVNGVAPLASTRMRDISNAYRIGAGEAPLTGAMPDPEANAPLVIYLLSDLAREVTGQIVRIEGDALSLMTHPAVLQPIVERAAWTPQAIAATFEEALSTGLQPSGVVAVRQSVMGSGSAFWAGRAAAVPPGD